MRTLIINNSAYRLAVLGSPIGHSVSPAIHAAAYRELGLGWDYGSVEVNKNELSTFLEGLDSGWRGLSLTMPLKQHAFELVTHRDDIAAMTSAVNTILIDQGDLRGFNTDVDGIVASLRDQGIRQLRSAAVLGGGATATSMIVALSLIGAEHIEIFVRREGAAKTQIELGERLEVNVTEFSLADFAGRPARSSAWDIVANTLPGSVDLGQVVVAKLPVTAVLFDVNYASWPTGFAQQWMAAGGTAISGAGMLLHQALLQVRVFTQGSPLIKLNNEAGVLMAMKSALPHN